MAIVDDSERRFSYRLRGLAVVGVVGAAAFASSRWGGTEAMVDRLPWSPHTGLWLSLGFGVALLLLEKVGAGRAWLSGLPREGSRSWGAVLRWTWLAVAVAAVASLQAAASMPKGAPSIVRLELAGTAADPAILDQLRTSVRGDWWFIPAYVVLLAILVVWSGAYYRLAGIRRLRRPAAYAVVAAGAFDVLENQMLLWGSDSTKALPWHLAATAAWAKFAILVAVVAYIAGGAHSWLATPRWVRRQAWALNPHPTRVTAGDMPPVGEGKLGIALSGGGIRAASITLGALQCLELDKRAPDNGLGWSTAHTITAISGGSNMAAGWSISRSDYAFEDMPGGKKAGFADRVPPASLIPQPWAYYQARGEYADATPEEQHLFNNLGYLASTAPRGDMDDPAMVGKPATSQAERTVRRQASRPSAYATVLAGLAVNSAVLFGALFVVSRPAGWAMQSLAGGVLEPDGIHDFVSSYRLGAVGPTYLGVGAVLLLLWVLAGQQFSRRIEESGGARGWVQQRLLSTLKWATYGSLILGAALTVLLWVLPELAGFAARVSLTGSSLASVGSAAGVIGAVVRILRRPAARFAPVIGGVAFGALLVFLAASWMGSAATTHITWSWSSWNSVWRWSAIAGLLVLVQVLVSPEKWSLAAFYRGKLRLAYATYRQPPPTAEPNAEPPLEVYRNDNATADPAEREPYLHAFTSRRNSNISPGTVTTPLVICATVTIATKAVRTHHGIPALSVTFDPDQVTVHVPHNDKGAWSEYKAPSRVINALGARHGKRLTTMLAAAVSSAAISPAMGRFRIGPTSMLLTFANLRLGVWLPNPRYAEALGGDARRPSFPRTGLGYLVKEFLGLHDLTDPYLYVTDGGHWENTGLVEMLRRPDIREVVCIDADSGPGDALSSLGKALELAPMECDVRIWIDLDPMRARPAGTTHSPAYAERTVNLGFFTRGRDVRDSGVVWYSKPGLAAGMPQNLLAFREIHADFPHASTLNQFFDTASFQAYRDLGRYNAREILFARAELRRLLKVLSRLPSPWSIDAYLVRKIAKGDSHWVVGEFHQALSRRDKKDWVSFIDTIDRVLATH